MCDPVLSPWDAAALQPIIEEAGGVVHRLGSASPRHSAEAPSRRTVDSPPRCARCWHARPLLRPTGPDMLDLDALDFAKGDGLVTVVAQDADSGAVLMVAHADREALQRTLDTGEMHYRSRTRGLWHKGATSGNVQQVVVAARRLRWRRGARARAVGGPGVSHRCAVVLRRGGARRRGARRARRDDRGAAPPSRRPSRRRRSRATRAACSPIAICASRRSARKRPSWSRRAPTASDSRASTSPPISSITRSSHFARLAARSPTCAARSRPASAPRAAERGQLRSELRRRSDRSSFDASPTYAKRKSFRYCRATRCTSPGVTRRSSSMKRSDLAIVAREHLGAREHVRLIGVRLVLQVVLGDELLLEPLESLRIDRSRSAASTSSRRMIRSTAFGSTVVTYRPPTAFARSRNGASTS